MLRHFDQNPVKLLILIPSIAFKYLIWIYKNHVALKSTFPNNILRLLDTKLYSPRKIVVKVAP
jgi:hypothetical protein